MGREAKGSPAERFALLRKASELAADAGEPALMLEAVELMAAQYQLDALRAKARMLDRCADKLTGAEAVQEFLQELGPVVEEALAARRIDVAADLASRADQLAARPAGRPFRKEVHQRAAEILRLRGQWLKARQAETSLQSNLEDAEANLLVGRWRCFTEDDWLSGLPHLVKGSDQALKDLARQELAAPPKTAEEGVVRGDAWWDLAQAGTDESKPGCLRRAGRRATT